MPKKIFNYGRQFIDKDDIKSVSSVLKSDFLTQGKLVEKFEKNFSKITNSKFSISCSNGTSALHLAFKSIGLNETECVIVPAITFVATANAAIMCGANVIFADVDPQTGISERKNFEEAYNKAKNKGLKVKAFVTVHLNGQSSNIDEIYNFAKKEKIFLIEDACHALGTQYLVKKKKVKVGSCEYSDIATFSFHPVKNITTGEGGMVNTKHEWINQKINLLRNHGIVRDQNFFKNRNNGMGSNNTKNMWYYEMQCLGYNYRLSDISSALGISQLKKLKRFIKKRKEIVLYYDHFFKKKSKLLNPILKKKNSITSWHLYVLQIDFKKLNIPKNIFFKKMRDLGINCQVHYIPLNKQPFYQSFSNDIFFGSEDYYNKSFSIPLHYSLNKKDVKFIAEKCIKTVEDLTKNVCR